MQTTHTPGPWEVTHQTGTDYSFDVVAGGRLVAKCGYCESEDSTVGANAKLIAAAPELLQACWFAVEELGPTSDGNKCWDAFRALEKAIAKATATILLTFVTIGSLSAQTITNIQQSGNQFTITWDNQDVYHVQTNATCKSNGWAIATMQPGTNSAIVTIDTNIPSLMFRLWYGPTFLWGQQLHDLRQLPVWDMGTNVISYTGNDRPYDWYFNQYDGTWVDYNNCGPASTAMVQKWARQDSTNTPASLRAAQPVSGGWWSTRNVVDALIAAKLSPAYVMFTVAGLKSMIDQGNVVILCLNASYLPWILDPSRHGLYYPPGTGHFIVVKGWRETDTGTWLEIYDPVGGWAYPDDGYIKGKNRSHDTETLGNAVINWWGWMIVTPPPGQKVVQGVVDASKVPVAWGQ